MDIRVRNKISKTQKLHKGLPTQIKQRLSKELLFELYIVKQHSLEDIARQFDCSRAYIFKLCKQHKIKVKSKSEGRLQAYKKLKFAERYYHHGQRGRFYFLDRDGTF